MKVIIRIILVGCIGFLVWSTLPFFIYRHILDQGIYSSYLKIEKNSKLLHRPHALFKEKIVLEESGDWSTLHFGHFQASFPVRSPDYLMFPYVQQVDEAYRVGIIVSDVQKNSKGRFLTALSGMSGKLSFGSDRILNLPFLKKYIIKERPIGKIWEDIFTLDIRQSLGLVFLDNKEALYNLFILKIRQRFFPEETKGFFYLKNSSIGLVYTTSRWYFYALDNKKIYSLEFQADEDDFMAKQLRMRFAKTLQYQKSTLETSDTILSEHRGLSYQDKHGPIGMVYLYSAWTHNLKERKIFRAMINFLERGQKNQTFLKPLYRYAFSFFGTSMSELDSELLETAEERLKRERFQGPSSSKTVRKERVFENEQEKIDAYLRQSKKTKENIDEENVLIGH